MRVLNLGRRGYAGVESAMRDFTAARGPATEDELWLVEHDPVFTQGIAGRAAHLLNPADIPVVQTNRGGQVTYHGPGQVVAYPLLNLQRLGLYVRELVFRIEEAVLRTLADAAVTGHRLPGAPGIFVRLDAPAAHAPLLVAPAGAAGRFDGLGKVAALGLKVSRHCSYHGVALNVAMDLEPFSRIDPCGYAGLQTIDLRSLGVDLDRDEAAARLARHLQALLV